MARGAGGVPVALPMVLDAPPAAGVTVTLQLAMLWPVGAVKLAVTGSGPVTTVPSAGVDGAIVGGAWAAVPPPLPTTTRVTAAADPPALDVADMVMA